MNYNFETLIRVPTIIWWMVGILLAAHIFSAIVLALMKILYRDDDDAK